MSKLQVLSDLRDLKLLRDLYSRERSNTIHGFYTLNNFITWFELNPQIDHVKVYVSSNWHESGMFIIEDRHQLFINSLKTDDEDVMIALKCFDWNRNYKITSLPASLINIVERTLRQLKVNFRLGSLKTYQRDTEQILREDLNCPAHFELRPLSISDADKINDLWYSKQDGSLEFLESLITYNTSMGIYTKDSKELIAWCTRCQCGFLGTLHVLENYRGRGLATLLINAFSRKIAEAGEDIRVMINENNQISQNLFAKLGFEFHEKVFIIRTFENVA